MNKKAMELSINTIIVIVLALLFLGLAIGLIYNWLGNVNIKIPRQCEVYPPTQDNPICVMDPLELSRNKEATLYFSVYNGGATDLGIEDTPTIICSPSIDGNSIELLTSGSGTELAVGDYKDYTMVIKSSKENNAGSYPCRISVGDISKAIIINLK